MTVVGPDIHQLRADSLPIQGRADRLVPEHLVKSLAQEAGIDHPRRIVGSAVNELLDGAATLCAPLVVKAFGPSIVHKTDVGAVELDVSMDSLPDVLEELSARLKAHDLTADGFVVEEQVDVGVELILGAVRREPFGLMVLLGMGGSLTEAMARTTMRLFPLTEVDAHAMVDGLPDLILRGGRADVPIDREALVRAILGVAGPEGLIASIEPDLEELEFNPITLNHDRVVALDARLLLREESTRGWTARPESDFDPLFAPSTVVVAGASSTRSTFGNRFLEAYRQFGWTDGLYALHPSADEIDGVPAIAKVSDLSEPVDYLLAAVPAARVPDLVRDASGLARFVHVVSGGFGETGEDGQELEAQVARAVADTGTRLVGPNCMGVYSPAGRQTFLLNAPQEPGAISVVSQSGSLASEIIFDGAARGLRFAKLVSVGNAIDVTAGELLNVLASDPHTETVGIYVEGAPDEDFVPGAKAVLRTKPLIAMVGGMSRQGAVAAASHTGALVAEADVWSGVASSLGFSVVNQMSHFLGAMSYLQRHRTPLDPAARSALLVGPGGGASVLAADAFSRHGVTLAPVSPQVQDHMRSLGFGAGTSMRNPIEVPVGPATEVHAFARAVGPILERQQYADVILHVNAQSWRGFGTGEFESLIRLIEEVPSIEGYGVRCGLVLRGVHSLEEEAVAITEAARQAGVSMFRDFDEAAVAVAAAQRHAAHTTNTL